MWIISLHVATVVTATNFISTKNMPINNSYLSYEVISRWFEESLPRLKNNE